MNEEQLKSLREPFDPKLIGKLPRVSCWDCSQNKQAKVCHKHTKKKCKDCGNYITTEHVHLDYVGHAEVTDRLLSVDAGWTWEPLAIDPNTGLPKLDSNGGLWIRLTVGDVTRLGYGDAQGKQGPNAIKEAIGDALRNGAMRFGVALDLWAKSDLAAQRNEQELAVSEPEPVNLKNYINSFDADGQPILTAKERAALMEAWKAEEWKFSADSVPANMETAVRMLIDSYIGTEVHLNG